MKKYLINMGVVVATVMASSAIMAGDASLVLSTGVRAPLVDSGATKGFAEAIAQEAFKRVGVDLTVTVLPSKLASLNSNSGKTDGELLRIKAYGDFYKNLVRVTEPMMSMEFAAYSVKDIRAISSWSDLAPYYVSYVNGWRVFEGSVPKSDRVLKADDPEKLFQMLQERKTEVVLYEKWQGIVLANMLGLEKVYVSRLPSQVNEMYMYLHKKHHELEPGVSQALRSMKSDGTYQRIYDETLGVLDVSVQ